MPDEFTPLFDEMRRRAITHVSAPGVKAARRTVHRRNTVLAAVAAAVVMAGGTPFIVAQSRDVDVVGAFAVASPSASADPSPRGQKAAALVPGFQWTGATGPENGPFEKVVNLAEGRYTFQVACAGPSAIGITVGVLGVGERHHSLTCTEAGELWSDEFTLSAAGDVRFYIDGDHPSGWAAKVTEL